MIGRALLLLCVLPGLALAQGRNVGTYALDGSDSGTWSGGVLLPVSGGTGQDFSGCSGLISWTTGTASCVSFVSLFPALASGQLLTNNGAALSWTSALANGTTATTQTAADNSTKVATTAYVDGLTITPASAHGAVALQAATPGTAQTGNANVTGTVRAGTALKAGWGTLTQTVPGTWQAGTSSAYEALQAGNLIAQQLATPVVTSVTPTLTKIGSITTVAFADLVDGDYFTLDDGSAYVFEFDLAADGVTAGRTAIALAGGEDADAVRDKTITAVNGTAINITASSGGAATVALVRDGAAGLPAGTNTENVGAAGFAVTGMADPTAATTYTYKVVAMMGDDIAYHTAASAAVSTNTGYATLSASNYNHVVVGAVTGASSYLWYRTAGGATQGLIGTTTAATVSLDDTGLAGGAEVPATTNTTGLVTGVLADGTTATTQAASDNSTKPATTAYVDAQIPVSIAPLNVSANFVEQRSGTNGQRACWDKTWTSATNYERACIDAVTDPASFQIGTEYGSAGGSPRQLVFGGGSMTSDVAPELRQIRGKNAFPTAATNTSGGNVVVAGGQGVRKYTIVCNVCGTGLSGKTFTVTANGSAVVLTAGAGAFTPLGTDDTAPQLAISATALAAAINGNATLAALMTATANAAVVNISLKSTSYGTTLATNAGDTIATRTSGNDGQILVPPGTGALPSLADTAGTTTGIYFPSPSYVAATVTGTPQGAYTSSGHQLISGASYGWSGSTVTAAVDTSFVRRAAGFPGVSEQALTAGTMTVTQAASLTSSTTRYDWTNAMVTALGAVLSGDVKVCTLPAKTRVKNAYVVIKTAATVVDTLTVAVGRTGATYIDYIVASDAMAAANTVYGDASGERGTNLTGYDLPSYTGTTDVYAHFVATSGSAKTLADVLTSTGTVYLEVEKLP